jgi:hypothetical protein
MQPVIAMLVNADVAECGTDKLTRAQPGRVGEVEQEAQPLRRRLRPAVRPLEPLGDRAYQSRND